MRSLKYINTVMVVILATIIFIVSCKKDTGTPTTAVDKTRLSVLIDSLNNVYAAAIEGNQAGQYSVGAKAALKENIGFAVVVKGENKYVQREVNNAVTNLTKAGIKFNSLLIQQVSPANLVAYWKFDGNANDASGNGYHGQLKTGWVGSSAATATDGGTLPVLTTDRYGVAGKAYDFNNAAYIEVPYNAALRPNDFTISLWVKRKTTSAGNYMISLNRWNGYKFQLQSNNFPYLTINTSNGYIDRDGNPATVTVDTWTMVTASYTSGTMKFYINGTLFKTDNPTGIPIPLATPVNLSIGNELPKASYDFVNPASQFAFYGASFFIGGLDDIRLYNKVLTDAEVISIYAMEKP